MLKEVEDAPDLDHVIGAHERFLKSVVAQTLLGEESRNMLSQIRSIFDLIIKFQGVHVGHERHSTKCHPLDTRLSSPSSP